MTDKAAFRATYSDWRLIKTRKVVQIVFEVPVEQAGLAYEVLDGMPRPDSEVWCAIARLKPEVTQQPRPAPGNAPTTTGGAHHKSWHEMAPAQQAGLLCAEQSFWKFIDEWVGATVRSEEECIHAVRDYCGVQSRKQITPGSAAEKLWNACVSDYRAWMREPQVV